MIEDFLKTINLSEDRFITKNKIQRNPFSKECTQIKYGDFYINESELDHIIHICNNNFLLHVLLKITFLMKLMLLMDCIKALYIAIV